jgi:hypothetical protein
MERQAHCPGAGIIETDTDTDSDRPIPDPDSNVTWTIATDS